MIKRLALRNFKSCARVDIEFDPLTVLIGRSGTGKTNIIDGIRFWRDFLTMRGWNVQHDAWPKILSAGLGDKFIGFEADFDVPGTNGDFAYRIMYEVHPQSRSPWKLHEESLQFGGQVIFYQRDGRWERSPNVVDVPPPGNPALGSVYGLPHATSAYVALTRGIGCYDFPSTVLTSPDHVGNDRALGLIDNASNYLAVFDTVSNALASSHGKEVVAALRRLNPTIVSLELDTQMRNTIYVGQRTTQGKALTLQLSQQSEGFRRFLAHLLALYQIPGKPTLIFEEAEKGIYPGALAALAEHFKSVAGGGTSQVIVTTHSPQLLDYFPVDSVRVVDMDDYHTKVGRLAPEQVEAVRQHLLSAGELLTADPARVAETV